ncbi:hypothetical protein N8K70_09950 [Microbacterium betulae]|uniref:Uncharacterized protein n=1 Tax=Microbacterium betulae TaxID=2981139 RepID=A0AA97FHN7_9MICO|nr:hypothetical protein [Microbacterium sp. AB]WOF21712.1 hypothetical protein N8K70_09950 [Microbacterium sp. AB]
MVADVLRLRAALLLGAFRATAGRAAARIAGAVALAAACAFLFARTAALSSLPRETAATALVLAGAGITIAFMVVPLLTAATDPLDPRRFRTAGLEPRPLAATLLLSGLISVPTWLVVAFDVAAAVAWTALDVPVAVAVAAAAAHAATCVVLARVAMALRALLAAGDGRGIELAGGFVVAVVLAGIAAAILLAGSWGESTAQAFGRVARALVFTPFGAWSGIPAAVGTGDGSAAWLGAVVGVATLALTVAAWAVAVRRLVTTVEHPVAVRSGTGLGWFAVLPGTATGAIAARSLVYWLRDSRYLANVVVIPVAGVLTVVPLLVAGVPLEVAALLPVPLIALFYGWLPHNDLAYDSSALWLHIASGVRGVADRAGRLAPVVLVSVPILVIAVPIALLLHGRADTLPVLIGVAAALLLSGFGLSSIASVVSPYSVARPGDGPFRQPQRSGSAGIWSQALVLLGALLLSAPTLWLGVLAIGEGHHDAMPALWTGLGTGAGVLIAGIAVGAAVFDARGTRLMEFAGAT